MVLGSCSGSSLVPVCKRLSTLIAVANAEHVGIGDSSQLRPATRSASELPTTLNQAINQSGLAVKNGARLLRLSLQVSPQPGEGHGNLT